MSENQTFAVVREFGIGGNLVVKPVNRNASKQEITLIMGDKGWTLIEAPDDEAAREAYKKRGSIHRWHPSDAACV